jgi:DNA-binding MarR family transcriptional regulator
MTSRTHIANEAWEALFRAQATIAQELSAADVWHDLGPREYGVLYALSGAPGGLRITELRGDVLLTQPGMSRLITRLETAGLVERVDDPDDGRACRIRLTDAGRRAQRAVGLRHGRHVGQRMAGSLSNEQLRQLRDLCRALTTERSPA